MDCNLPVSSVQGIFQAKYWSGSLFSTPGHLSDPGIKPASLASSTLAGRFFTASATWEVTKFSVVFTISIQSGHQELFWFLTEENKVIGKEMGLTHHIIYEDVINFSEVDLRHIFQ